MVTSMASIYLIRHGETEWSLSGQHTGTTDIPLTENGRERARMLRPMVEHLDFGLALSSPLQRARDTAELAGIKIDDIDSNLMEWNYGELEGVTTPDYRKKIGDPNWVIWNGPPGGETPAEVSERCKKVIARCLPVLEDGKNVALVAHGHLLRILTATWLGLPGEDGKLWILDAGALCSLGFEREQHVITGWNQTPQ